MFCIKCGQQLPDDARFCFKCGHASPIQNNQEEAKLKKALEAEELDKERLVKLEQYILENYERKNFKEVVEKSNNEKSLCKFTSSTNEIIMKSKQILALQKELNQNIDEKNKLKCLKDLIDLGLNEYMIHYKEIEAKNIENTFSELKVSLKIAKELNRLDDENELIGKLIRSEKLNIKEREELQKRKEELESKINKRNKKIQFAVLSLIFALILIFGFVPIVVKTIKKSLLVNENKIVAHAQKGDDRYLINFLQNYYKKFENIDIFNETEMDINTFKYLIKKTISEIFRNNLKKSIAYLENSLFNNKSGLGASYYFKSNPNYTELVLQGFLDYNVKLSNPSEAFYNFIYNKTNEASTGCLKNMILKMDKEEVRKVFKDLFKNHFDDAIIESFIEIMTVFSPSSDCALFNDLQTRLNKKKEINRIIKEYENESGDISEAEKYTFKGFLLVGTIIQSRDEMINLYEISVPWSSTHALLKTDDITYSSQGMFSLYVKKAGTIPIKLRNEFGGFTQEWPVYQQLSDSEKWEDDHMREMTSNLLTLKNELQAKQVKLYDLKVEYYQDKYQKGLYKKLIHYLNNPLDKWNDLLYEAFPQENITIATSEINEHNQSNQNSMKNQSQAMEREGVRLDDQQRLVNDQEMKKQVEDEKSKELEDDAVRPLEETQKKEAEVKPQESSRYVAPISVSLRSTYRMMHTDEVIATLNRLNFVNKCRNSSASGINHQYQSKTISGDIVVIDHITGLMWHQSGSDSALKYAEAQNWLADLNRRSYASYSDWRLPTLEEGASLLESSKIGNLYIDSIFSHKQWYIWTGDSIESYLVWGIFFNAGCPDQQIIDKHIFIRPVRSLK